MIFAVCKWSKRFYSAMKNQLSFKDYIVTRKRTNVTSEFVLNAICVEL